jgi:Fe-S-cluster containining protein
MKACSCEQCVSACRNDPGRLVPSDLKNLAAHLNRSMEELVADYLVLIPMSWKNLTVYVPAPAKLKGKNLLAATGSVVPEYYVSQAGRCVFLDEGGMCTVHTVKPFECAAYVGCENTFLGKPYRERDVEQYFINRWKQSQHLLESHIP